MAHRVEQRQVQHVVGEAVVEGVTADVVRRFQGRRGGRPAGADGPRRQERPQQLGLKGHRPRPLAPHEVVVVRGLGHHQQRGEARQRPARFQQPAVRAGDDGPHDSDPLDAVDHREPDGVLVPRPLDALGPVRQTGQRPVDVETVLLLGAETVPPLLGGAGAPGQRRQPHLLDIGQVQTGPGDAQPAGGPGDQTGQLHRGRTVGTLQHPRQYGAQLVRHGGGRLRRRHLGPVSTRSRVTAHLACSRPT
ncbi:hypothetical protein ACFWBI_09595 [Streptomyces sp. NPDC059982]|uniref:hypothetical protein n=1 Tax=unclassified Streptomyces TaxID=2593676 RepID=UPI00368A5526